MENSVVIVSFSSRIGGNCDQISEYIRSYIQNQAKILVYKFSDFTISPCGSCNYQCFAENTACPHYEDLEKTLLAQICSSNQTFFVVPNYCDYPCSNFFVYNERSLCCFQNHAELLEQYLQVPKKFIVVSGSKAESFRQAFLQHTNKEPELLYLSAKTYGKRSIDGNILSDTQAQEDLAAFLDL